MFRSEFKTILIINYIIQFNTHFIYSLFNIIYYQNKDFEASIFVLLFFIYILQKLVSYSLDFNKIIFIFIEFYGHFYLEKVYICINIPFAKIE